MCRMSEYGTGGVLYAVHQNELKNADCFDRFAEVYVVGKNFEWTYIKTHESSCGPYFMKR